MVRQTLKLMQSVSQLAGQENERSESTRHVSNLLGQQLIRVMSGNNTSSDHCVSVSLDLHEPMCTVTPLILEEKVEMGKTATDPSAQVQLSYLQYWMDPSRRNILEACCCPTILVGLAGPHMCIMGAVLLDKTVVQHFTGWMFIGEDRTTGLDQVNDLGSPGVDRLAQGRHFGRFFPWIDSYPSNGQVIKFDYIKGLQQHESCTTFLARKVVDGEKEELVVIKFVDTYSKKVHEFMAEEGLAPRLIYFVDLADRFSEQNYQGLSMVVMEHLEGDTLEAKYWDRALPSDVRGSIAQAIETLAKAGFVHGDLRRPNVMIDSEGKVKIIDFDWAGREMEVRYPLRISSFLFPENQGIEGRGEIRNAHDKFMLELL
ncbi:hypothetical protein HETIRDRAFT_480384 [Heterobasidion irregulare TC 32-1]|uniref:Protein kinase domain-containing protein n=1 Tax=Heterobasidion irregulare (strain TC 32-1) TaxID=747525 RepID=W4JTT2_HETIT|nr:uncharacterized protein HETIRDRAFT_480384 [Heterobasidion irregulare TC 32-1]ETW76972.1 hypothetical protein HETIRDRAFT_480384 [Heterobasidion irregulare TC 32-1]